ncbi:transposase [Flavisolibacter sp. BT320]|nr:transposase [Flavisolibacter longurius]
MGRVGVRNLYVDYVLSGSEVISAVDLSKAVGGRISHDQVSRMLSGGEVDDHLLYKKSKALVKSKEVKGVVTLSIDDSIAEKPYSEINGVVNWHYDHTKGCSVKGINFVSALWSDEKVNVPMSLQVVEKQWKWNEKKQVWEWQIKRGKNGIFQQMVKRLTQSRRMDYVLSDSWYSSKDNMDYVYKVCETDFVMALKSNRLAARSEKEAMQGAFKPLEKRKLGKRAAKLYLKGLDFPVLVVKKTFKHGRKSSGTLYLATSDLQLGYEAIFDLYKRRWRIEEYHKSLKSNCSLEKCHNCVHFFLIRKFFRWRMALT